MQLKEGRRTGAIAMKVGMLPYWNKWGERFAVTVLHVDDCRVLQVKLPETNGYCAVQLGAGDRKEKRTKGTIVGHCRKAGVDIKRNIQEFRVTQDSVLPVGTHIRALHFVPGQVCYLRITAFYP
jgi:large subunit ribosomal protein L3